MPRSRSRSIESSTCACISRASRPPQVWMKRSASVDLPWSTWAMMEKLRIRFIGAGNPARRRCKGRDYTCSACRTRGCIVNTLAEHDAARLEDRHAQPETDGQIGIPVHVHDLQRPRSRARGPATARAGTARRGGSHRARRAPSPCSVHCPFAPRSCRTVKLGGERRTQPRASTQPSTTPVTAAINASASLPRPDPAHQQRGRPAGPPAAAGRPWPPTGVVRRRAPRS